MAAAVVVARRHLNTTQEPKSTAEPLADTYIEKLPAKDVREVDLLLGTLLMG
jgi:hypothetical protein